MQVHKGHINKIKKLQKSKQAYPSATADLIYLQKDIRIFVAIEIIKTKKV